MKTTNSLPKIDAMIISIHFTLGQYGKVYKGTYKRGEGATGVKVAIKTVKVVQEKENFLKEMNIMSKLLHPNIVRLFGLVQQGIYI